MSVDPKLLMVAGAEFADWFLFAHARALAGRGGYRMGAVLARPEADGRPAAEAAAGLFDRVAVTNAGGGSKPGRAVELARAWAGAGWDWPLADGQRGSARRAAAARLHRRWYARHLPALAAGSDLCHWHCADPEWLGGLRHVPPGVPVVLSFWGSDLYRQEGVRTYALQARACGRADRLTVGSVEMREVLLAKFGRHLAPKVRLAHYGAANLDAAAAGRRHRDDFLARHGLPADRVRVVVGNSGGPGNRHPEVLARLAALPPDLLARVTVLLPMSYGGDEAYRAEVRRVAARMPFDARVLDAFLPDPEVGALRAATDVLVHVPVSDQFSAAMCEAVAAGAVLVAGAWLPYSRLRLAGVPYREVGELDDLSGAVAAVLADWPAAKRAAEAAGPRVRPLAAWGEVVRGWDAVYRELLPARGEGGDAGGDPGRRVGDAAAAVHRGDPQAAAPARG